jgi:hypothetical protein
MQHAGLQVQGRLQLGRAVDAVGRGARRHQRCPART